MLHRHFMICNNNDNYTNKLPPNDELWYNTIDGLPIELYNEMDNLINDGDGTIIDHYYDGNKYIIKFSDNLYKITSPTDGSSPFRRNVILGKDIGISASQYITELYLPKPYNYIDFALCYRAQITKIIFPYEIFTIHQNAFAYCTSLSNIIYKGTVYDFNQINIFIGAFDNINTDRILCDDGYILIDEINYKDYA